jgi:outer membrane protein assembly factor BamA
MAQSVGADPCASTSSTQACGEPTFATRALERYRNLKLKGITPMLGSIIPGSSFSAGVELRRERLRMPIGVSFATMWSIRGYHEYDLRIGRIRGDRSRAELGTLDADVTSVFSDGALLAPGLSFSADIRQRVYPRVDFFGLGQGSSVSDRSDFGITGVSMDGVVQWQHDRHFGLSVRGGTTDLSIEPGTNHGIVNLEDRYGPSEAPGLGEHPKYHAVGVAAIVDYRDRAHLPSAGSWVGVAVWRAAAVDDAPGSFTRVVTDARQFVPLPNADHVLALHAIVSTPAGNPGSPTPFYLQPTLGGSETLRGFGSYRLRGDALWTATAEYRWHAQRWVEIAPFVDVGAVAGGFSALGDVRPAVTPGIGVRARTSERVIGRLDYAHGRDGQRVVLTLSAPF